jgi:hypothetical protein
MNDESSEYNKKLGKTYPKDNKVDQTGRHSHMTYEEWV